MTTIEERRLFNKLMVDNPCVGTPGSTFFLLLHDKWNEHLTSQNIYGKTVAHLARHHKNEWTHINAKSRAVQEGSDGLVRLQNAVGVIREGIVMPLANELDNWVGADEVVLSSLTATSPSLFQPKTLTAWIRTASIPSSRKPSRRHLCTSKGKPPKKENL